MAKYVKVSTISCTACQLKFKKENMDRIEYVIEHLQKNIRQVLPEKPDLIVLPELCDYPEDLINTYENVMEYLAYRGDKVLHYLQEVARTNHCYVAYPTLYQFDGDWYNCCMMIDRRGEVIGAYKKCFPVTDEFDIWHTKAGTEATIFECDFGRVGALICFDINFEAYRKMMKAQKPDMVLFVANFNGSILQNLFAYETRSYLVSAVGYGNLHGKIISPVGETVAETTTHYNHVTMVLNMDYAVCHLDGHMEKLKALKEKYGTKVKIYDPCDLGSVLISSESEEFTVQDLLDEFQIKRLDEYLDESAAYRDKHI